jgi:Stress responsive A/B Barrel Domain
MSAGLRHVVLLRFVPQTAPETVDTVVAAFAALAHRIDEVVSLAWGINNSPEGLDHGFTHAFTLHFADTSARDAYLVHPVHQAFGVLARPHLADVLVIDHLDHGPTGPSSSSSSSSSPD